MTAREIAVSGLVAPSRQRGKVARKAGYSMLLAIVCLITFFPIYWMVLTAIRPSSVNLRYPPKLWPSDIDLSPFVDIFKHEPIERWILNSTLLALIATVICVVLSVLGAFALSAMRFHGRGLFAVLLLMTQMLPEALILVPIFQIFQDFPLLWFLAEDRRDLREHLWGLALIHAAFILPICIWVLKNMFDTIPKEIREAALVDGAGQIRALFQIILPLTLPGLVAVAVVAFFYSWNEYLFAQLMIQNASIKPASVGLASMITMLDTPIERLLASGLIFAIPPVVFYIVMQRYIVAGITAGAVKG